MVALDIFGDLYLLIQTVFCLFFVSLTLLIFVLGHILPLAIGHHCHNESASTWRWFVNKLQVKFPDFCHGTSILIDRDKGGREAMRFFIVFVFVFVL